jgi:uncharacterized RmlC-like cupin family protein
VRQIETKVDHGRKMTSMCASHEEEMHACEYYFSSNSDPLQQSAIVELSPSICGTLMRAQPHTASAVHHHGGQDTIVYAVSGHGSLVSSSGENKDGPFGDVRQDLKPGDWALIPAFREHQEINDGEEEAVWVIVRAPEGIPVVENLEGWGKSLKA